MESSIYKGSGIYKTGDNGGGGENVYISPISSAPDIGVYIVDKNGYIFKKVMGKISPIPWAIVDPNNDFSEIGLGQVNIEPIQIYNIGGDNYQCLKIGGAIWMLENLDYKFEGCNIGAVGTNINNPSAWYYDNDESTYGRNGKKYGLLYNGFAASYLQTNRNLLIPGWHVPTNTELSKMFENVGGATTGAWTIKSRDDWGIYGGTNDFGMNIRPYGYRNDDTGYFLNAGTSGYIITGTINDSSQYRGRIGTSGTLTSSYDKRGHAFSLRLVKD